jgi:hypothetical protein
MTKIHISSQHEHPHPDARSRQSLSARLEHLREQPLEPVSAR